MDSSLKNRNKPERRRKGYGLHVREWFDLNFGDRGYIDYLARLRGYESIKELENEWAKRKGFDSHYEYCSWLHGKSVRSQEDECGQIKLAPKDLDSIAVEAPRSEEEIEEAEIQEQKNKDLLMELIKQLPERVKRVVMEKFYSGKTLREIAEEIGMTKEGVRQIEIRFLSALAIDRRQIYSK